MANVCLNLACAPRAQSKESTYSTDPSNKQKSQIGVIGICALSASEEFGLPDTEALCMLQDN